MADMDITMNIMAKIQTRAVFIAVMLMCMCSVLLLSGCRNYDSTDENIDDTTGETALEVNVDEAEKADDLRSGKIIWDDVIYTYNDHLSNFLFMGVDKEELVDTTVGNADAGQTDALFLLSWDRVTDDVTVISIPRDTMTTINVFSKDGTDLGPTEQHISLAFGYGDGKHESCKLTKEAVSRLFYRIPIQGYCAMTLDALVEMNVILGEVTVTVPNDSLEKRAPEIKMGSEVEITTENIELFVRYRDIEVDNSALLRLERQNVFLNACYKKILQEFDTNPSIITDLYEGLTPHMVTNIGNDQFVKIMESLAEGGTVTQWTVPGEGVTTDSFDEYHVDEAAFYEQILESFFEKE